MFIGRENEKELLLEKMNSKKFEFGIIYGRRRVGKTSLIKEVIHVKKGIYYVASEMSYSHNIDSLSDVIALYFNEPVKFSTLEEIFQYLVYKSKEERVTIVIDEFTYLMSQTKGIMSILQNIIDNISNNNICLVLSGRKASMNDSVISYNKPLYGRATFKLRLEAFDYYDSSLFYPSYSKKDKIIAYSVFGGIPYYLKLIDQGKSVYQNIIDLIISESGILRNEVEFILKQELRSLVSYGMILDSIATGSSKLNDISNKSGILNTGNTATYLNTLIELEIVEKLVPINEKENSRKSIYRISDNLVKFMYTFIYPNKSAVNILTPNTFFEKVVEPNLTRFLSFSFENILKEFLIRRNHQIEDPYFSIGKYWGTNNEQKLEVEFDVVGINNNEFTLFECKWTKEKFSIDVYNRLKLHGKFLNPTKYGGFSLNGFTKEVSDLLDYRFELDDLFNF